MTESELHALLQTIDPVDPAVRDAAAVRQAALAKPPKSLGKLEDFAIRLAGITGQEKPKLDCCRVIVLAADNGVVEEGVSCTPQSVTWSQCVNMTRYMTGMSALAHASGDDVVVCDVGVAADCPAPIINRKLRYGTANLTREPAMTRQQAVDAIAVGIELAHQAKLDGIDCVGVGEMGIGNTTTSALVLSALTGLSVEQVTGRGGGLTDEGFAKKKQVIAHALALHHPDPEDPIDVLHKVGGLDLAAMCGTFIGCALERIPAVVDGYISIVAALAAVRLCPAVREVLFLSHASFEVGYRKAAEQIGLEPCLLMDMRLGEGSGCPLMFRILQGACAVQTHMATFAEAAINDDYLTEIRAKDSFTVR